MGNPHRDRSHRPNRNERHDPYKPTYTPQRERQPLRFEEVHVVEHGQTRGIITAADGERERVYSFSVERIIRDRGGRYFRPADFDDLSAVMQSIKHWFDQHGVEVSWRD